MNLEGIEGKIVKPQEGFQMNFCSSSVDVVWGGGNLGGGKAGLLDSHVVTPFGLRQLKDIKVGDIISNPDTGGQERVVQLHPIAYFNFYEVKFADGTSFKCSEGHLWKVRRTGKATKKYSPSGERDDWRVWDTKMMSDYLQKVKGNAQKGLGLSIPYTKPVQFTRPKTPTTPRNIPPYVLGALIGDGCFTNSVIGRHHVEFVTPDEFIANRFVECGYDMSHYWSKEDGSYRNYRLYDKGLVEDLRTLKLAGHCAAEKFIPSFYKYATIAERKELLRGLIDTDGYVDDRGHISYTTTSRQLAEDVAFVVRSIGGRASISTKKAGYGDGSGVYHDCRLAYNVYIATQNNSDIVSLPKKLERVRKIGYGDGKKYYFENRIVSIEYIGRKKGRCITVDNPSGLYCVDNFIVTHNSYALVLSMAEPLLTDGRFRGLISRKSLQNQKAGGGFVDKFKDIFGEYCSIKESDNPRISFDSGAFCDLTYIDDSDMKKLRERAKGWEYDLIAVDEMTEMSFECFFYIMTRNRGSSKSFTGKMRATLNPKRSHWSRTFLDWYIGHDGFIIPERNGIVRYFYINGDSVNDVVWGRSKEDVYRKCRIDIDRKLQAFGGEATYKNLIKSFVFYQGKISENKSMLGNNLDYIGSVAASGGRMAQALLEGNFNVDPDEDAQRAIKSDAARRVFLEDPATNGEMWITVDLADYGSDNLVALVWNGFHVIDKLVLTHTTPRDNALNVKTLAQDHKIAEAHIIFDGTSGRYFNDYIPDAICYISRRKSFGIYKNQAPTLKDLCYLRLTKMINAGRLTFSEEVAQSIYRHNNLNHSITIQDEFLDECAVVNFNRMPNGGRRLDTKKEMNAKLGKGRSMDLLDPCAMRMLPCVDLPYGDEINGDENGDRYDRDDGIIDTTRVNVFDETLWA